MPTMTEHSDQILGSDKEHHSVNVGSPSPVRDESTEEASEEEVKPHIGWKTYLVVFITCFG